MTCHSPSTTSTTTTTTTRRVALLGMPNTGKSTLFNRLTGAAAAVGNWPGITVDLLQAPLSLPEPMAGQQVELVDLPGTYDLGGFSDDERVVRQFLENFPIDLVLVVINAAQVDRQLRLLLQVKALGLPVLAVFTMADEARHYGVEIDGEGLAEHLGLAVEIIDAKRGQGHRQVLAAMASILAGEPESYRIDTLSETLAAGAERLPQQVEQALAGRVQMPAQLTRTVTETLDRVLLHPVLGLPCFFLGMLGIFWLIWTLGLPAQDAMDWLAGQLQRGLLEPVLQPLPPIVQDLALNGIWNGVATVASFVPLIVLFFMLMAVLEDSGYLARSAYLMDALMARLGLDGRSFVLQMMGFGCNVPALMGTRIMRSHTLRLLTMLVIPFALCSARLQVFVFIIATVFPGGNGALVLFSLYVLSFGAAIGTAALFQGRFPNDDPFVLELPPYRLPTLTQVLRRGWQEVTTFLRRASRFIILGCVAVWTLTALPPGATGPETIGGHIGQWLSPVMHPIGIDPYLTLALIFGFVAKEVVLGSLAVIYGLNAAAVSGYIGDHVSFAQGYSFCLFCLLYTPCLTTLVTLLNESKSWRFTLLSVGFSLALAWLTSWSFYQSARLLNLA
ncbi:ferrous iron transport protein B [Halomicronema hongdechloris C2206]|uniref:Ferrous iron transport protein B n=1 Tax=Halomicronema hongdechloris C2206 TaxID=1641165 RepID=A0A1Z3HIT6_9CYAN|nr:ferrous iron transport protein B [Halomicronema hongdechloris]ASC70193.1 ferrous iron transport protein B [Halomicronema hongdechloris C2206]